MIDYTTSVFDRDLMGIIDLQKSNLPVQLSQEEMQREGFVTVVHSFDDLKGMNDIAQHVIAKDTDKVVAYLLAMTAKSKYVIPILVPMFEVFDEVDYRGKRVADYNYIVVGQVCVGKAYRGQGILDKCYETYSNNFSSRYDFAITEIATKNSRSINAHKRIGFEEIHKYVAPDKEEWSIVVWDWKNNSDSINKLS